MWSEAIPELERKLTVCCGKGTYKVVLKGLNGAFGGIHTVVVGFHEEEIALILGEEPFDLSACLIVHDVQFDNFDLCSPGTQIVFIAFKDGGVL